MCRVPLLTVVALICIYSLSLVAGESEEKRLGRTLLRNYQTAGVASRPVTNSSHPLVVTIGFALIKIAEFDQLNKELRVVGWVTESWKDELLVWSPEDWGGVTKLVMDPTYIFTPDTVLFNALSKPEKAFDTHTVIMSDGTATHVTQYTFSTSCDTNPEEDDPTCSLIFGSWTMDAGMLDLQPSGDRIDATYYVQHHEWELLRTKAEHNEKTYPCCPDTKYGDVTFTLTLKRRPQEEDEVEVESAAPAQTLPSIILFTLSLLLFHI